MHTPMKPHCGLRIADAQAFGREHKGNFFD
jgi:hypothetical protein